MSNTRILIVLSCIGLGLLLTYWVQPQLPELPEEQRENAPVPPLRQKAQAIPSPPPRVVIQQGERQSEVAKKQLHELRERLRQRQLLEATAKKTRRRWEELRMRSEGIVRELIDTNLSTFKAQRILAQEEDDKELRCVFCDGEALHDFCTVCDSKGLCPSCDGIGRERFEPEKPCVACEGRTSCFYCAGRKKMKCVFCEKGRITTITPWPSYRIELP